MSKEINYNDLIYEADIEMAFKGTGIEGLDINYENEE